MTQRDRHSLIGWARPWCLTLPPPDGQIGQGDRQSLAFFYSGISALASIPIIDRDDLAGRPDLTADLAGRPELTAALAGRPDLTATLDGSVRRG